ncbi:MAG TPA: sigma-70 family RNA polymerase sigma factor [Hyphomonadaceae bacterium]|nr:sigma-70 family RNA polymerase sigma factor [Hyphomonadaceae bacterium]
MAARSLFLLPMLSASAPADPPRVVRLRPAGPDEARTPLPPPDAERFRDQVMPHLDAAYAFARFLCRDPSAAEDIVHDAAIRALKGFSGMRGNNPKAWLLAIVRSTFLNWARSRKTRGEAGDDALAEMADASVTPEGQMIQQASDAAVRRAVEALPEPFREAIVLRELQDMSYKEISDITGVPIGTVMSRLARARSLLAAALSGEAAR